MKQLAAVVLPVDYSIVMVLNEKDRGKNKYTIPKGKVKIKENILKAAKREFKEETSIEISNLNIQTKKIFKINKTIIHVYFLNKISQKKFDRLFKGFDEIDDEICSVKIYDFKKAIKKSHKKYKGFITEVFKIIKNSKNQL